LCPCLFASFLWNIHTRKVWKSKQVQID
jgi:hypothetical protein